MITHRLYFNFHEFENGDIMKITGIVFYCFVFAVTTVLVSLSTVKAQQSVPQPIVSNELNWISPAVIEGLAFSWLKGSESDSDLYVLRVRLEPGTKIPPHRHPDQRLSTVLSGTLYVGFGDVFDETAMIRIETGNAYIAEPGVPHFIWAKDGRVEYQETGIGPTATQILQSDSIN